MKKVWISLALVFLVLAATNSRAATSACERLFNETSSTVVLNNQMSARYPELDFITENPDVFVAEVRALFEEQKKTNPSDPYSFGYSKVGKPVFKFMSEALPQKAVRLAKIRAELEARLANPGFFTRVFLRSRVEKQLAEIKIAEEYLNDLLNEAWQTINSGNYTYRQTVEFSYFFSRFIGHHDGPIIGAWMRMLIKIDDKANGYRQLSIQEEYSLYKRRAFTVFQLRSPGKTFGPSEIPFTEAFYNAQELEAIAVPTSAALNDDIFMRLMPKKTHFFGVTLDPILADGFNRPGGRFLMHDVRHESTKYYYQQVYMKTHKLTAEQMDVVNQKSDDWILEMNRAIDGIKDADLQNAVRLFAFNYHHDRGAPIIPSVFLRPKNYFVILALYTQMKIGGQGVKFPRPVYNFRRADAWLKEFWTPRLQQEQNLLQQLRDGQR